MSESNVVEEKKKRRMPKWDDPLPKIDSEIIGVIDCIMLGESYTNSDAVPRETELNLSSLEYLYQNIKKSSGNGSYDLIKRIEQLKPIVDHLYLIAKHAKKTKDVKPSASKKPNVKQSTTEAAIVKSETTANKISALRHQVDELKKSALKKRSRRPKPVEEEEESMKKVKFEEDEDETHDFKHLEEVRLDQYDD